MVWRWRFGNAWMLVLVAAAALCGGCAPMAAPAAMQRLIAQQAMLDFSGLQPATTLRPLKVIAAVPIGWQALPMQSGPLYVHQQWRSPSHANGVGVAYVRMPLPLSAKFIVWFAKMQYAHQETAGQPQGQLLGQWTDSIGREWFEAENARYHVRGYAVTSGCDAWIVYSGYRVHGLFRPEEIGMAARSMDTFLPLAFTPPVKTASPTP